MLTKKCTRCGKELEATTENFYVKSNGKYGLESECKVCKRFRRINAYNRKVGKEACLSIQDMESGKCESLKVSVKSNCRYAIDEQCNAVYLFARGTVFKLTEDLLKEIMSNLNDER